MSVAEEMHELLTQAFAPTRLAIINDSAKHSGHMGDDGSGESHFTNRTSRSRSRRRPSPA